MKTLIVVPTMNEEDVVEKYWRRTSEVLNKSGIDYSIVFVDDSTDGTVEKLKKIAFEDERVFVLHRTKDPSQVGEVFPRFRIILNERPGLAGAVIDAFSEFEAEKFIVMDVDLQHPPETIPVMDRKLNEYDFVIGSRYVCGGKIEGWSMYRLFVSRAFIFAASMILGNKARGIKDLTSGFFGVRGKVVKKCLDKLDPIGWKIMLEVLVKCSPERVCEIPITFRERAAGESKAGIKVAIEGFKHIASLKKYKP